MSPTASAPLKLLIVDDEPHIRSTLARAFDLLGYRTDQAESGQRALDLIGRAPYDLMVLDLRMPGLDGVEVMRRARQIRPDLLIIVLTGHATVESAIAAVKSDAADYVLKPAGIQELAEAVARALKKRSTEQQRRQLLHAALEALRQADDTAEDGTLPVPPADSPAPGDRHPAPGAARPERFVQVGPLTLDREKRLALFTGSSSRPRELTEGESAILSLLMARPDSVLSSRELASAGLGYELEEREAHNLVRPYIFRLRRKIETHPSKPRWILTVRGRGYLLTAAGSPL